MPRGGQPDPIAVRPLEGRLRVTTGGGAVLDDPSDSELLGLLEDIDAGEGNCLIVERLDDVSGQTYVQVLRTETDPGWEVEYRAGGPERHFHTTVGDVESAHHLVAGWAMNQPNWLDAVPWTRLEFNP